MTRTLLTGNGAAAWGARLAKIDYVPAFPITPQTEIIETIAGWIENREFKSRLVTLDSEHSMVTAAGAAASTGVRVFFATSSQGLLYGMEMLYTIAGWRAPLVMVNVSRGLSAPITLEPDHNDVLAARDCGFLQIHCSTCQEVLDSVLIAYRLAEDARVRLPVLVNLDGFYLSFTREPVTIPDQVLVDRFLPPYDPENIAFRAHAPMSQGTAVLGGSAYSYFRYQMHLAANKALTVYDEVAHDFAAIFGRCHEAVECYRCDDADYLFVMMDSFATKAREAVDQLRENGLAIGLLRPRLLRPFPSDHLREALAGKRAVAVIDQNLSIGHGGILYMELAAALAGGRRREMPLLVSFVGGLGGREISSEEFFEMAEVLQQAVRDGHPPEPRLLFTEAELREVRKQQDVARAHRQQQGGEG
ncbi:MAG: pyruvate synthase [Desulfobulbaceae bacterium]|nr:pyruvate synthase [Desulfobulbaceae bacterium]